MRDNSRTPVLSAVAGVVVLAGVFAFTVLVPKIGDDDPEVTYVGATATASGSLETPTGPVELPDRLGEKLVAVDLGTLPAAVTTQLQLPPADALKKQEAAVVDGFDDVFGTDGAFRLYAADDGKALAQVTVLNREPGLFAPDTPPISASDLGVARAGAELVKVDDAVCSITWGQDIPEGQPVDPTQVPQQVRCQQGAGGRTYELRTQGLTVDETVSALDAVATA